MSCINLRQTVAMNECIEWSTNYLSVIRKSVSEVMIRPFSVKCQERQRDRERERERATNEISISTLVKILIN